MGAWEFYGVGLEGWAGGREGEGGEPKMGEIDDGDFSHGLHGGVSKVGSQGGFQVVSRFQGLRGSKL